MLARPAMCSTCVASEAAAVPCASGAPALSTPPPAAAQLAAHTRRTHTRCGPGPLHSRSAGPASNGHTSSRSTPGEGLLLSLWWPGALASSASSAGAPPPPPSLPAALLSLPLMFVPCDVSALAPLQKPQLACVCHGPGGQIRPTTAK
jgi:hypothetical protein